MTDSNEWVSPTRRAVLKTVGVTGVTTLFGSSPAVSQTANRTQWQYETGGIQYSSPTVVNGIVYVGTIGDGLYALSADSGTKQWVFQPGENPDSIRTSPTVVDGTVFFGSNDSNLYAVNAETGNQQWRFKTGSNVRSSPTVANGTVYFGSGDNNVYAVDIDSGEQQWVFETGFLIPSSPTVVDGTVFIGSFDNNLYAITEETGEEQWAFETLSSIRSSPTVADDTVFVSSTAGFLYAVDAKTGKQQWKFELGRFPSRSSPTVSDGTVFVGANDNKLYAVDVETGEKQWVFETGDYVVSSPTVANGTVYVGSWDSNLYAIDTQTGEQQWAYKAGFKIESSPTVVDGTLFVGSLGGNLYALNTDDGASSEGSRVRLGTLGHTNHWALQAAVDSTITLNNVGSSAWEVTAIEGDSASAPRNETNPRVHLEPNSRYIIRNNGWSTHPFEIQNADGTALLSQDPNTTGSFENNSHVNWVDNGDELVFTLTETLSAEMNSYVCTVHTSSMEGAIESSDSDTPKLGDDINFDDRAFDQDQLNAVFSSDEYSQNDLSGAINEWFTSDDNTVNGVSVSQNELSALINFWFNQ